jgi:hypothetical protein
MGEWIGGWIPARGIVETNDSDLVRGVHTAESGSRTNTQPEQSLLQDSWNGTSWALSDGSRDS